VTTIPMLSLLLLTSAGLCISICALAVALRTSARSLSKQLAVLSTRQEALELEQQSLEANHRKLRSRLNMQNYRAREKENGEDASTDGSAPSETGTSSPGEIDEEARARARAAMNRLIGG